MHVDNTQEYLKEKYRYMVKLYFKNDYQIF